MHFSFLEKLGAAALICAWLVYGANFLGNKLVSVDATTHAAVAAPAAPTQEPAAEAKPPADLGTLLAAVSPADGEKVFKKCVSCHSIEKGGANKVGPNLWNVVGGPKAHMDGFAYSSGLAAMHNDVWSYVNLDKFLANPKEYVPGTKMTFAGLKNPEERAAVILYMRANTENPPPLPAPGTTPAAALPADGATLAALQPRRDASATGP
jgi:cytochrome c